MPISRRKLLKSAAAAGFLPGGTALAAPALLRAAPVRLGFAGPWAGSPDRPGEADRVVAESARSAARRRGLPVEISTMAGRPASEAAGKRIADGEIDLMLVASGHDVATPVAAACEGAGIPCISTAAPWQPWFFGQQAAPGDPASWKGFDFAFHFSWGLEDLFGGSADVPERASARHARFIEALIDVAVDAMIRSDDPANPRATAAAIAATSLDTAAGRIEWNGAGLPRFAARNVCKVPFAAGGAGGGGAAGAHTLTACSESASLPKIRI